jgi:mono/diheme cytochrome c family protein
MTARGDSIATRLLAEYQVPMPNLGVTKAEAEAIMAYLVSTGDASATGQAPEPGAETADAGAGATRSTDGDPSVGRELFTGARRLENGGAACISCHAVAGIGASGGGMLAKDLTEAAATYGDALPELVRAAPFTVMRAVFGPQPLTEAEVADLSAFLVEAAASGQAGSSSLAFPLSGLAGAILLGALAGLAGRGRLKGVRKPLIGGRG